MAKEKEMAETGEEKKPALGEAVEKEESTPTAEEEKKEKSEEPTTDEKLAAAEKEIALLKDKYLRQVAEFDNYRKRILREKTDLILNGGKKVLESLLPILDDLDRAAENMEKSGDLDTLKEGVMLIIDKLTKTLATHGLKKMETAGEAFNTDFHEAIALVPTQEDSQKGNVIDCVQPGYLLNDKVLRHAKVVVGQ